MPPSLEARPTVLGYAQNQHETLRMLRDHHAHPPTQILRNAQMCVGAGLLVLVVDIVLLNSEYKPGV